MKDNILQIRLLPNKYKKAGIWVLIAGLPVAAAIVFVLISTGIIPDSKAFFSEWNYPIVYYPIIIGLVLLNFSEEKQEDEMVQNLRYKSFMSGVYFLAIGLLFLPFYSNIYTLLMSKSIKMPDVGGMLGALTLLLVYTYASFKYNLHITRKALETDEE
ncbi:hypothetical protein H8S95_18130 [Pontibacter sp. KCTC 32443]|uniref:hypothetical protein n=1 Tax=Pontibacter TaxID=323449 RepID=UPI00164D730D|nr:MULTISPECIES: hypothetical protein [Pontibacter]MBC5776000.1 hypothetical protein [Pontibacter sp. KCTC 32443]